MSWSVRKLVLMNLDGYGDEVPEMYLDMIK